MKRLIAWTLLVLLLLLLPACGQTPTEPSPSSGEAASPSEPAAIPSQTSDDAPSTMSSEISDLPSVDEPSTVEVSPEELYRSFAEASYIESTPPSIKELYQKLPKEKTMSHHGENVFWYDVDDVSPGYDVPLSAFHYEVNPDGESCTITKIDGIKDARILVVPLAIDGLTVTGIGELVCADSSLEVVETIRVTNIGKGAFARCEKLYKVNISYHTVEDYAFYGCTSLTDFPFTHLESIGEYAFKNCNSITEVSLQPCLTHIGREAFSQCMSLNYIYVNGGEMLPDGTITLPTHAFYACPSVQNVVIDSNVKTIQEDAFLLTLNNFCNNISFYFNEGVEEIGRLFIITDYFTYT